MWKVASALVAIVSISLTPGVRAEEWPTRPLTPEYLTKFVQSEIAKWAVPIRAGGVSVD